MTVQLSVTLHVPTYNNNICNVAPKPVLLAASGADETPITNKQDNRIETQPKQTRDPTTLSKQSRDLVKADKRPNHVFKAELRPNQTRVETQPCFQRAGCADNPVVREAHLCRAA